MKKVGGTSATGTAARVLHIQKSGKNLMLCVTRAGDLFNRDVAIIVSSAKLLKQIAAANEEK
jgi:hypothetical protein